MMTFARKKSLNAVLAAAVASASLGLSSTAHADEVPPDGKGVVGGALLGAEVVVTLESLLHIRSGWAYLGGAIVGAGGGGAGGYMIEQSTTDGHVPVYMMAGGLALFIPGMIMALNGMTYVPSEGSSEDKAPSGNTADPGKAGASSVVGAPDASGPVTAPGAAPAVPTPSTPVTPAAPAGGGGAPPLTSLLNVRGEGFRLGVPIPEMRPTFSMAERRQYGMENTTEVRLPLFRASF